MSILQIIAMVIGIGLGLLRFATALLGYGNSLLFNQITTTILASCCIFMAVSLVQRIRERIDILKAEIAAELISQSTPEAETLRQVDLEALATAMQVDESLSIQDRRYRLKVYPGCFVGAEAVDWLVQNRGYDRQEAEEIGVEMMRKGFIVHVSNDQPFQDAYLFYRFTRTFKLPVYDDPSLIANLQTQLDIEKVMAEMFGPEGVDIRDRNYHFSMYLNCFVGSEAVDWLIQRYSISRQEAVEIGQILLKAGYIHHVVDEHDFEDKYLFYEQLQTVSSAASDEQPDNGHLPHDPEIKAADATLEA